MNLARYRPWFYAAAIYNFVWGTITILCPNLLFDLWQMPRLTEFSINNVHAIYGSQGKPDA